MEQTAEQQEAIPGIGKLIDKIDELIRTRAPEQKDMWTTKDIAAYTGMRHSTVRDVTTKLTGFPTPVRPHDTSYQIWIASEVKKWLRQQR
jgi:predicted DNA-binding transcriptional regulator AlpA